MNRQLETMNRCVFLDRGGLRCTRGAPPGELLCSRHASSQPAGPEEEPAGDEPIESPPWARLLRRFAAAAMLAYFGLQLYLVLREVLK